MHAMYVMYRYLSLLAPLALGTGLYKDLLTFRLSCVLAKDYRHG